MKRVLSYAFLVIAVLRVDYDNNRVYRDGEPGTSLNIGDNN